MSDNVLLCFSPAVSLGSRHNMLHQIYEPLRVHQPVVIESTLISKDGNRHAGGRDR